MQKRVLEVLKRGIFLILHFDLQANGGGGGYSLPSGYATGVWLIIEFCNLVS